MLKRYFPFALFLAGYAVLLAPKLAIAAQMASESDVSHVVGLVEQHMWVALAAVVIGGLVRLSKMDAVYRLVPLPKHLRPYVALGLGAVSGVLEAVIAGKPWVAAIVGGLVSGAIAIAGHEAAIETARDGKELGAK